MAFLSQYKFSPQSIDQTRKFWKFRNTENWFGNSTYFWSNAFISRDPYTGEKRLYYAGHANGYGTGLGEAYSNQGFNCISLNNPNNAAEAGEYPEEIYLNNYSMYVLSNLGNLYSMGYNAYGQLGLGDKTDRKFLTKVTALEKNVAYFQPSSGNSSTGFCYAITKGGQLYTWGYNNSTNWLGIPGSTADVTTPTLISTGTSLSTAGLSATKVRLCDEGIYSYGFVIDNNKDIHVAGYNASFGQLGTGNLSNVSNGFRKLANIKADNIYTVATGGAYSNSYILSGGWIYSAGYNGNGQLMTGDVASRTTGHVPATLLTATNLKVVDFTCTRDNVMAVMEDGTVRTAGNNGTGAIGDGTTTVRDTSLYNPNNSPSSLGLNSTTNKPIKVAIHGLNSNHTTSFILTNSGKIYTSGYNANGQCGIGTTTNSSIFLEARHPANYKFVDFCVFGHTSEAGCTAVDERGDMWTIGPNDYWQAGTTDYNDRTAHPIWRRVLVN